MTSRGSLKWQPRSELLNAQDSFENSSRLGPEQHEKLKNLHILNYFPILTYFEKGLLLIDFFQIFALMWNMAQPWPMPYLWSSYTRPLVWFNLDVFSTTSDGALAGRTTALIEKWGEMNNYPLYALGFAIPQFLLFFFIVLTRFEIDVHGVLGTTNRHGGIAVTAAMILSYIFYLPAGLAVFRLYHCDDDNNDNDVLSADPSVECWGNEHLTYFLVCTVLTAPVFFGLPMILYSYVAESIVYRNRTDHEKRIQVWEILQMLELDDYWIKEQMWVLSSFTLYGAYFRVNMTILKASLLVVFVFFRFDFKVQSVLCAVCVLLLTLYYTLGFSVLPFRTSSSNYMLLLVLAMLNIDTLMGMANAFGVRNSATVGSRQFILLVIMHVVAFGGIVAVLAYTVYKSLHRVHDWPSFRTMNRLWHNSELLSKVSMWVEVMRESFLIKADFLLAPIEVADIGNLEESIRKLRLCWMSAKSSGSLFETPIGEQLEEMLYIHSTHKPLALRKHDYWDDVCRDEDIMEKLRKRNHNNYMLAPRKRRILLKLLAYRFIRGNRGKFNMDIALEQLRLDRVERERQEAEIELYEALAKELQQQQEASGQQQQQFGLFFDAARNLLFNPGSQKVFSSKASDRARARLAAVLANEELDSSGLSRKHSSGAVADSSNSDADIDNDQPRFSEQDILEATKMISRLKERTELALNKHHHAKQTMLQQVNSQQAQEAVLKSLAPNMNGSDVSLLTTGGLRQISTMDLIKETVDPEEQKDLEELYFLWDEAIQLYEVEQFPGDYEQLNREVENWYTYRSLVTQRLEVVVRTLQEHNYDAEIDGIVEGDEFDDNDEDEEDNELLPRSTRSKGRLPSAKEVFESSPKDTKATGATSDSSDLEAGLSNFSPKQPRGNFSQEQMYAGQSFPLAYAPRMLQSTEGEVSDAAVPTLSVAPVKSTTTVRLAGISSTTGSRVATLPSLGLQQQQQQQLQRKQQQNHHHDDIEDGYGDYVDDDDDDYRQGEQEEEEEEEQGRTDYYSAQQQQQQQQQQQRSQLQVSKAIGSMTNLNQTVQQHLRQQYGLNTDISTSDLHSGAMLLDSPAAAATSPNNGGGQHHYDHDVDRDYEEDVANESQYY